MAFEDIYLDTMIATFSNMKNQAEKAMTQLTIEQLNWVPNQESNSIAILVKHLHGNMISRWTNFLTEDGEKPYRDRDGEFEGTYESMDVLMTDWESGWSRLLQTLQSLSGEDLEKTIYVRAKPQKVVQAIEQQVFHYSYHIGQIVYIAKFTKNDAWETLTIPRKMRK